MHMSTAAIDALPFVEDKSSITAWTAVGQACQCPAAVTTL